MPSPATNSKYLIVDGVEYHVPLLEYERKGDILDREATRTQDGVLHRKIIGTFYNYTIKIGRFGDMTTYNALWNVLTAPSNHTIEMPHDGVSFEGYFGSCKDNIYFVTQDSNGKSFRAKGFSCNIVQVRPARTPESEGTPAEQ